MNKTFSLQHIPQTANLDSNLILGRYKPDLMLKFMEIKCINPKLKQSEIAKEIAISTSV